MPKAFAAIEDVAEADEIGELTLKGFHRPVFAYNVKACGVRTALQRRSFRTQHRQRVHARLATRYGGALQTRNPAAEFRACIRIQRARFVLRSRPGMTEWLSASYASCAAGVALPRRAAAASAAVPPHGAPPNSRSKNDGPSDHEPP